MAFISQNSKDYIAAINSLVKPTYQSKYDNLIQDTMNKILNRESFSYDFNADPLYQNYKDQYTKLGKEAAMNAAASVSTLTGGYGNSYAGTAASQANQQYLTQLNEKIPELYNAAMNKYQMETQNLYNQFGMLQTEEGRQYGMHRDDVSDYYSDYGNLQQGYSTALQQENFEREFAYKQARDEISDSQWQQQFDLGSSQWDKNFNYQQQRDSVSDSHWQQEFDTKNAQWEKEYQLALKKARSGGSGGSSRSGSSYESYTWTGGKPFMGVGSTAQIMTEEMADNVLKNKQHKSKEAKEEAIINWLNWGYITETDAAILMDKYKL